MLYMQGLFAIVLFNDINIAKPTPKPIKPGHGINGTSIIEFEEGSSNIGGKSSARAGIIAQAQEYVLFEHNI